MSHTNSGFVLKNNIEDYVENRAKYVVKGKGLEFQHAVQQMDDFLKDPSVRVNVVI